MDRWAILLAILILLVVTLGLFYVGWRRKQRGQSDLQPESPPADLGNILGEFTGLYVATTLANEPLNRVVVGGLGYRAKTTLVVADVGIVLPIAGQQDILVPAWSIREVTRASWVIDKGVESHGLNVVGWVLGAVKVDSYFRLDQPEEFGKTVETLVNRQGKQLSGIIT